MIALLTWSGWQAASFDPLQRPFLLGDEATYVMAAESLAWDLDLTYSPADHERFARHWGGRPDLILLSGNDGRSLHYGKPFLYPLYLAPFLRLAPVHGAVLANALLLWVAALVAAVALDRLMPPLGPLLAAIYIFCSVTFGHVFWVQHDLFLMTLTVVALALICVPRRDRARAADADRFWPWMVAATLLVIVGTIRPPYFALLLPLFFPPRWISRRTRMRLLVVVVAALVSMSSLQRVATGAWSAYGAQRRGFTDLTGYPGIDFPASDWSRYIELHGNYSWLRSETLSTDVSPSLLLWDTIYVFLGRNVGLLPYFLPLFLPLIVGIGRPRRWPFLLAFAIAMAGFIVLSPFNFYGGGGALANRYFLPLYPLFWFLPSRRFPLPVLAIAVALSLPPLLPLLRSAGEFPVVDLDRGSFARYRYATGLPQRWLPHETSQKHLRALGSEDVVHHSLWVRFLDGNVRPVERGFRQLRLVEAGSGEIVVGISDSRVTRLEVEVEGAEDPVLTLRHGSRMTEARPGARGELELVRPSAVHHMWWPGGKVRLYRLQLEGSGPLLFELDPSADDR